MKEIVTKNQCTGCTACKNICPKKAISMKVDEDGFKYPVIDQDKCINCGLCKKTCPVLNKSNNNSINECFVAYTKENKYKDNSSSGGIFPLIANKVLENDGIVIGAAFDKENKLKHIAINKKKDLISLKGSKYLQSDLKNIFNYIKDNIENKKILFVGTPCQVAGLKSFLKKDYDNLICIDLICHGVPSPKLFEKYIKELENNQNDKLVKYDFRDKSTGWDSYSNTAIFEKSKKTELQSNNNYMKLFLSDVALRESCYNCNFKLGNKYSDITLGDFWGVKKYYPDMYNKDGVSAIIVNTNKGIEIINSIKDDLVYKICKLDEIVDGNPNLVKSSNKSSKRDLFFNEIDVLSIKDLVNKYVPKRSIFNRIKGKVKGIIKRFVNK